MPNQYSPDELTMLKADLISFPGTGRAVAMLTQKLDGAENNANTGMDYCYEAFDITPELEKVAINNVPLAEEKKLVLQLHLSPSPMIVHVDRLLLQPLLFKLLSNLLTTAGEGSAINIHVMNNEEKCIIESINQGGVVSKLASDDYFKKYRITNPLPNPSEHTENVLPVYQQLIEDMRGELLYSFTRDRGNFFRLKLALA